MSIWNKLTLRESTDEEKEIFNYLLNFLDWNYEEIKNEYTKI